MLVAILPILIVLVKDKFRDIRVGPLEALLLLYVVIRVVADYHSRGYSDAQRYAHYLVTAVIGPFLLGRYLITNRRMDVQISKAFVLIFLIFFYSLSTKPNSGSVRSSSYFPRCFRERAAVCPYVGESPGPQAPLSIRFWRAS